MPFSAQPQVALAPQGVFGSLIGAVAPTLGHAVGGLLGNAGVGQQIGSVAGHLGGLLPFSAQPQVALAPQGVFGSLIGAVAPTLGHAVGGLLGNANVGQQIGSVAGHLGGLLPFSAQPQLVYA
ncbi:phage tail tape-measure protein [Cupriavidus necator]|nr:phage tail tape-measure protein [Cupriavidus necator]